VNVTVGPGAAKTLVVSATSPQISGTPFDVTVTAHDVGGNVATGYTGTIQFSSSDSVTPGSGLPNNYTFVSGDNGVHTFTNGVTLKTVGPQMVTATDSVNAITGFASITVSPGAANALVIFGTAVGTAFPSSVVVGFANSVTIVAQDANGNTATGYNGTVHFASNNGGAALPSDYAFVPADSGIHLFAAAAPPSSGGGVMLNAAAAASATITVSASGLTSAALSAITVVLAPALFQGTATLIAGGLRGGQIFIAGGSTAVDNSGTATRNTYFYDPAAGTMLPGPLMALARYAHTATATTGGQIVIAGGDFSTNTKFEFELCSTSGTPSCAYVNGGGAAKNGVRCNAAAALATSSPTFRVIIGGGDDCTGANPVQTIDVWDGASPTTTTTLSTSTHQLTVARSSFTATPLGGGLVLFAGGASTATADLFTNSATITNSMVAATGAMQVVRSGHTATPVTAGPTACPTGPCVLIAGGITGTAATVAGKTWEIYDGSTGGTGTFPRNAATAAHDLVSTTGRKQHAATAFANGKIQLAGGVDNAGPLKSTESFDPATQTWSAGLDFASGLTRNKPAFAYTTALQDQLIVVGGNAGTPVLDQNSTP
jgi:hypothetical protein